MRIQIAACAAGLLAIAVAACGGGQSSNYIAPPAAGSAAAPTAGLVALSTSGTIENAGTASGITGALTFGPGTGSVTAASSSIPPAGLAAVTTTQSAARVALATVVVQNVYYVTITSPTGATLSGLPGISLTLSSAASSTFQEGQWNGSTFATVPGSTPVTNAGKTAITFPATTTPITIAPNGSIYLAFYQNGVPPPSGPNVLADSSFEGAMGAFGSAVNSTGWTQCTIKTAAAGATLKAGRPFSTFTPVPGSTPAAVIAAQGTAVAQGTKTPAPTFSSVPVFTGTKAAVIGALFNNFNAADFAYNGLCQSVTVPNQPSASLQVLANGTENDTAFFDLQVDVLDSTGAYLANLVDENAIVATPPGDSAYRTINIPQSSLSLYTGQTVQLFVGMWTKAGSGSGATTFSGYYFVDDVMLFGIK